MKKSLLGLTLVLLTTSCTQFSKKSIHNKSEALELFSNKLSRACLSGSGKGRIKFMGNKYVFNYESLNKISEKKWLLGLQVPIHGEELLTLDWSRAGEKRAKLLGSFYKRLSKEASTNKKLLRSLKVYLVNLAIFIKAQSENNITSMKKQCKVTMHNDYLSTGMCKIGRTSYVWEMKNDHLYLKFPIKSNYMVVDLFAKSEFYNRMSLSVINKDGAKVLTSSFEMDLFVRECSAK